MAPHLHAGLAALLVVAPVLMLGVDRRCERLDLTETAKVPSRRNCVPKAVDPHPSHEEDEPGGARSIRRRIEVVSTCAIASQSQAWASGSLERAKLAAVSSHAIQLVRQRTWTAVVANSLRGMRQRNVSAR